MKTSALVLAFLLVLLVWSVSVGAILFVYFQHLHAGWIYMIAAGAMLGSGTWIASLIEGNDRGY